MAQRGIREYDADRLLQEQLARLSDGAIRFDIKMAHIAPETDLDAVTSEHPWLLDRRLVVKPDQLFGKRGKNDLILLDADWPAARAWIEARRMRIVEIEQGGRRLKGRLTDFLIEPFVPHDLEFYLAITAEREADVIHFSTAGGIDIESQWDQVITYRVPIGEGIDPDKVRARLPADLPCRPGTVARFISALHRFYAELHLTYLELNPFTLEGDKVVPLDAVLKVDDAAAYQCAELWGRLEFPTGFGSDLTKEEARIAELDSHTGASLKLTLLNPEGRVWTMVAGGGASVIFADTAVDLGYGEELANYGEYSGNPSTQDTYEYACVILDLMTRHPDPEGRPKHLIIGGGIANFTDVAKTFTGVAQALREFAPRLQAVDARVWVRRGGPNDREGLELMRRLGEEIGVPIEVHGPELHMTRVMRMALAEGVA